jgi:ribonuclease P protein component
MLIEDQKWYLHVSRAADLLQARTREARVDSVRRNRLKRAIREAFRAHRANLGSMDYNVVIPGAIRVDHRTVKSLRNQLRAVWGNENHF